MTPYTRVLAVVGGAAVVVSLAISIISIQADLVGTRLRTDSQAAVKLEVLGDRLLAGLREERETIGEYLMSRDPRPLARYRQAVADVTQTSDEIVVGAGDLTGVIEAVTRVDSENDAWLATAAAPAGCS